MRLRFLLALTCSISPSPARATDATVDALFAAAPEAPDDGCGASQEAKDRNREARSDHVRRLRAEMNRRRQETKAVRKKDEAALKKEMAARTNMPAGMDRAKLKSMSKAEKLAMAQQMAAQGQAPGTPGGPPAPSVAEVERSQDHQQLVLKVGAAEEAARSKLTAFEQEQVPRAQATYAREIAPLRAEWQKLTGDTIVPDAAERAAWTPAARQAWDERQARGRQVGQQLAAAARRYCDEFAPRLREALRAYRTGTLALRADWDRLEQGQADQAGAHTGVPLTRVEPGLLALEGLQRYLAALDASNPFRFDVSADLDGRNQPAANK